MPLETPPLASITTKTQTYFGFVLYFTTIFFGLAVFYMFTTLLLSSAGIDAGGFA